MAQVAQMSYLLLELGPSPGLAGQTHRFKCSVLLDYTTPKDRQKASCLLKFA